MYQTIIFDLDGTLTDSSLGIINSVCYALKKMDIPLPAREELTVFIGPPLRESFAKLFHLSDMECQDAVRYYRQYFSQKGLFENHVYPEVRSVLKELKEADKQLIIATSKPEDFAKQILEHFQLDSYFDYIAGATMDYSRSKKADVIAYALESMGLSDMSNCLMVGDREHDILGAQAHHMDSVGVLYGFGSKEELETAGANFIIDQLSQLPKLINLKKD